MRFDFPKKIKFGLWGFSKFEFRAIESIQYSGICSLGSAEEASERHSVLAVGVVHT
jgi:hypothetical protein